MRRFWMVVLAAVAFSALPMAECTLPVDLRARKCCGDVVLTWTAPQEPCLHYRVYRGILGDYTTPPELIATVRGTTTYTDKGACLEAKSFWYDVRPGKKA